MRLASFGLMLSNVTNCTKDGDDGEGRKLGGGKNYKGKEGLFDDSTPCVFLSLVFCFCQYILNHWHLLLSFPLPSYNDLNPDPASLKPRRLASSVADGMSICSVSAFRVCVLRSIEGIHCLDGKIN
jgi:hypothetical protein